MTRLPAPRPAPPRAVLYVHFHGPVEADTYARLLALLSDLTPIVQALPPDAAYADVTGALNYFRLTAPELAARARVRALVLAGTDATIGVAHNPLLARMIAADGPSGAVRTLPADPDSAAAFLRDKPPGALLGVGASTARRLASYGLDTLGRIATAPPAALQRILGTPAGRRLHDAARGIDPTRVTPAAPPRTLSAHHTFDLDEVDAGRQRTALVTLVDDLAHRLRADGHVTRRLALSIGFADRSTLARSRTLAEPTAQTRHLLAAAHRMHAALGLQRARVREMSVQAGELTLAELAPLQLSLDEGEDDARRAEAAADAARARFGPHAVRPAAVSRRARSPKRDAL